MRRSIFLAAACLCGSLAWGQTVNTNVGGFGLWQDVLQYSDLYSSSTARMNGISGAQAGLGADAGSAATNPAGLALMRRSEFTFSPALIATNTRNTTRGYDTTGRGSNFHIGQMGLVIASPTSDAVAGRLRGQTFAITLSRINHFNNLRPFSTGADGVPNRTGNIIQPNSLVDYYLGLAGQTFAANDPNASNRAAEVLNTSIINNQGMTQPEFEVRSGFSQFLIDAGTDQNGNINFFSNVPTGRIRQSGRILDRGYQNQVDFAYGINLDDRTMLGGSLAIPYLNHTRDILYQERLLAVDSVQNAYARQYEGFSLQRRETFRSSGVGFNAKFGVLHALSDNVRFGASIQTPSWYRVNTEYSFSLDANFVGNGGRPIYYSDFGTDSAFQPLTAAPREAIYRIVRDRYSMRTPGNLTAGLTFLDSKYGFLSIQATALQYGRARLGGDAYQADNDFLRANVHNFTTQLRLGGEALLGPLFRARAGLAWLQNPFKGAGDTWTYSVGGGARFRTWYLDASVNVFQRRQNYQVFTFAQNTGSLSNNVLTQITLGSAF